MFTLIIAIIKSLFIVNNTKEIFVEAMGVIVKAEGECEKVELIHNGGNGYTITVTGKLTGRKTTVYRNNANNALGYYTWIKSTYKMV